MSLIRVVAVLFDVGLVKVRGRFGAGRFRPYVLVQDGAVRDIPCPGAGREFREGQQG